MTPAARIAAAAEILDRVLAGTPAEKELTTWARRSRFAGAKDRAAIRDHVFDALRRKRSAAAMGGAETGRGLMLGLARQKGVDPDTLFTGHGHAPAPLSAAERAGGVAPQGAVALDCPDWLMPEMRRSLGDQCNAVLSALRERAPVFLRVNLRRGDRDTAIAALGSEGIVAVPHDLSPTALRVEAGARRIAASTAYRDGLVELQDAASQAVADAVPLSGASRVLDFCAGGGGKALAMAARCAGRVFAHDAAPRRMSDLPDRAFRAGATITPLAPEEVETAAPFDVVLADVPCSGSGAWRRAPEAKWRLTSGGLEEVLSLQARIVDRAAGLVAPGKVLAYATCSLLRAENEDQIAAFLQRHPGWTREAPRRFTPLDGGDGFYFAALRSH